MAENRSEAFDIKEHIRNKRHPQNGHLLQQQKCSPRLQQHRARSNPTPGGPGMQAIFLDSSKRPCGTGVFLPRRTGTDSRPTKKPACSSVLLPSRVVQTLNLNVRELGSQTKSPRDTECNSSSINRKASVNKKGKKDTSSQQHCYVISHSHNVSPDIFLPKEWTY